MTPKKKYLCELFLKTSKLSNSIKSMIEFNFGLLKTGHSESINDCFEEVKKEYNINEYNNRAVSVIDKYFSEEDLDNLIKFFLSPLGQKMSNMSINKDLNMLLKKMIEEAEEQLKEYEKKYSKKRNKKKESYT